MYSMLYGLGKSPPKNNFFGFYFVFLSAFTIFVN